MKIINSIFTSFGRTIGRIVAYLIIALLLIAIGSKCGFILRVNAVTSSSYTYDSQVFTKYDDSSIAPTANKYGSWTVFTPNWGNFSITPWFFGINIKSSSLVGKDYVYISGYSESTISSPMCDNVNVTLGTGWEPPSESGYNNGYHVNYYPFTVKCYIGDNNSSSSFYVRFQGGSQRNDLITGDYRPWIALLNTIYFATNEDTQSAVESVIKQQTEQQHKDFLQQYQEMQKQTEQQEETNKQLGDLNDNLTSSDTSGAESSSSSFFDNFSDDDYGLSDIITMPLTFINNITSSTCTPLKIPLPFVNKDVELPCMTFIYQKYFGDFLSIYQTITTGMIAYWICINLFAMVKNFKDPESDNVEVMEL